VWKVPLDGEPVAVTDAKAGIVGFDYAPKADAVFYTVDATATDRDDFAALRARFGKIEYGHGSRTVSELYSVSKPKGEPKKVLAESRYVREFAVTADGTRVAMISALDDTVVRSEGESRVDVWEGGKITTPPTDVYRAKAASPYAWLEGLAWNPDGTRYAFCAVHDAYPAELVIGERKGEQWTTDKMPRVLGQRGAEQHVRGYGSPLKWAAADRVSYLNDSSGSVGVASWDVVKRSHAGAHRVSRLARSFTDSTFPPRRVMSLPSVATGRGFRHS
jgi:hypothetical protein